VSLQACGQYNGRRLQVGRVLASTSDYTRHFVTYKAAGSPSRDHERRTATTRSRCSSSTTATSSTIYTNGRGLAHEQDYLAREGYVGCTPTCSHAQSDDDPTAELRLRLGYTEDVINAVLAIKRSTLPTWTRTGLDCSAARWAAASR
jgi:hypothetical protein